MNKSWVYILECSDKSYYVGCTTNLEQRFAEHQEGKYKGYTSTRLPVKLVWSEEFTDVRYAAELERQLKGWSRKKKVALIQGDFNLIHELAQSIEMKERREKRK